jgi:hypothetical protein
MDSRTNPPPLTLGYEDVETVLAQTFGVRPAEQKKWFRAKMTYIRRFGLTPVSGRGRVIRYDTDWITRWYFALLLLIRADRDPAKVIQFIISEWKRRAPSLDADMDTAAVERGEGTLRTIAARARASQGRNDHVILTIDLDDTGAPKVGYMTGVAGMTGLGYRLAEGPLVMVFDLSAALAKLDRLIDKAANPEPEPPKPKTAQEILRDHMRQRGEE